MEMTKKSLRINYKRQPKGYPMKYTLATATVLSLLGGMMVHANANNSSVEFALESQGGGIVSLFHKALINTGVARELNENTEYTVFAPTNAAFSEIQPRDYPCFYSVQCRAGVAAVLRNHIIPRQETIKYWSTWGVPISTIGSRGIHVEESYKNEFTVEGHKVIHRSEGDRVSLFTIDGVIADSRELASFQRQPMAVGSDTVVQKTVTTRRTSMPSLAPSYGYQVPGGYTGTTVITTTPDEMMDTEDMPDDTTQTITTTRTRTTQ
jgi:uncharacterized surface protein with fasciclin (FAS1) repeats